MSDYRNILKARVGLPLSNYYESLWAKQLGGWTITGVLPLTFTAKGGTAGDWVIYGNDDVGENLINVADFTVGVSETHNAFKGILPAGTYTAAVYQNTALTSAERNTLAILKTSGAIYESANTNYHLAAGWHYLTFTIAESENVSLFYWTVNASNSVNCTSVMLVKGSTAPDHYIPYQQGVGQRTANLMRVIATSKTQNGITFTVDSACRIIINGTATANVSLYIDWVSDKASAVNDVEPSTTYTVSGGLNTTGVMFYWGTFNSDGTRTQSAVSTSATFTTDTTAEKSRAFIFVTSGTVCDNLVCEPMLVKGSTPPKTHIPYGYKLPLTISSGTESKDTDIYIGDSPLTEGETVSKSSTGVAVELFDGENTVSTTLYNKPAMKIKYK